MQEPKAIANDYPEDRYDNPTTGIRPRRWVILLALVIGVFASIYWAFTAEIPVTVESQGILLYPSGIANVEAKQFGSIKQIHVSRGDNVRQGDLLFELSLPELRTEIAKSESALLAKIELNKNAKALADNRLSDEKELAAKQLKSKLQAIETIKRLIDRNRQVNQKSLETQETEIAKTASRSQDLLDQLNEQRRKILNSIDRQLATKADLTRLDSQLLEGANSLSALEDRKNSLRVQQLKSDQMLADLENKEAEINLVISEIETSLLRLEKASAAETMRRVSDIDANQEILANLRSQYDQMRFVKAPFSGTIIELPVGMGQSVRTGEVVATVAKLPSDGEREPLRVTAFFPISLGKQVSQNDAAFVTPTTVQRERYGSISAEVEEVYSLPMSAEEAIHVVGNREVLRPQLNRGGLLGIHAKLLTNDAGELSWSSNNSPPKPTAGTTVSIRIVVERRRPISYVLPFMNRAVFGTENEETPRLQGR